MNPIKIVWINKSIGNLTKQLQTEKDSRKRQVLQLKIKLENIKLQIERIK